MSPQVSATCRQVYVLALSQFIYPLSPTKFQKIVNFLHECAQHLAIGCCKLLNYLTTKKAKVHTRVRQQPSSFVGVWFNTHTHTLTLYRMLANKLWLLLRDFELSTCMSAATSVLAVTSVNLKRSCYWRCCCIVVVKQLCCRAVLESYRQIAPTKRQQEQRQL